MSNVVRRAVAFILLLPLSASAQLIGTGTLVGKATRRQGFVTIQAGCGNSLKFDQADCGAGATTLYTTIDAAINAGTGGTAISACGNIDTPTTSYYLTADLAAAGGAANTCLTVTGRRNVKIDFQGHTVTGRVVSNQNNGSNDGLHIFNGTVTCASTGGGTAACVYLDNGGSAFTDTQTMSIHHMTITNTYDSGTDNVNSLGTPFVIYIDRTANITSGQSYYISIRYNTINLPGNNYNSVRTGTAQLVGQPTEISNNNVTISAGAGTAQGLVIFGALAGGSRIHNNVVTAALTAYGGSNASTARPIAFDQSVGTPAARNEIDNNDVTANDNRCFRARDTQYPYIHDNYCHDIRLGGASSGTLGAVHLGDADPFSGTDVTSIICSASAICTMTINTGNHNFLGHAGDVMTIVTATPSTLQETAVITSATTSTIVYPSGNIANASVSSSGNPTMRYADEMNAQVVSNTFAVKCAVNKQGIIFAQRGAVDVTYGGNTITTDGNCATGFTGSLFALYEDFGMNTALIENNSGFGLLGSGTIFNSSSVGTSAVGSGIRLCNTGGAQNNANAIWKNISSGPCP